MKCKGLLAVLVCIAMLGGCNMSKDKNKGTEVSTGTPLTSGASENLQPISLPDLSSEQGIREYLAGEWVFDKEYVSDVFCKMHIDEDLKIHLFFHKAGSESKSEYTGQIRLDRAYAEANEVPDLLRIELVDTEDVGGDFLFLHRTVYDGKRVMSWFFAGLEDGVFAILGPDEFESVPDEIVFEKVTGEASKLRPRKNDGFYTVFWGKGAKGDSLWLDDVQWTPPAEDDFASLYPRWMTLYENDVPESVLYTIAPDEVSDILGDDLFPGTVYFVQTDKRGNITQFINAEYKKYIDNGLGGILDTKTEALIFDIIEDEIKEYLDMGMAIWFTGETTKHDGEDCYDIILGTNHEKQFVKELFYAVNTSTRRVYKYDVLTDTWE